MLLIFEYQNLGMLYTNDTKYVLFNFDQNYLPGVTWTLQLIIMPSDYNFKASSKMDRLNLEDLVQSKKKRPKRPTESQGLKNKATYLPKSVMISDWDD